MAEKIIKKIIFDNLSNFFQLEPVRGHNVIKVNNSSIIYVRYNKSSGFSKNFIGKFWFGITVSEYNKYLEQFYDNFYIVLVCLFPNNDFDYLIIPADIFEDIKKEITIQSGQWKFNLFKTKDNKYFLHIPHKGRFDITEFCNNFDFTPKPLRKPCYPSLGEYSPLFFEKSQKEMKPSVSMPMNLQEELMSSVRDSSNPKNFEISLEKFFNWLGFTAKRIGGPGETDIIVLAPVKFIIEGKSTKMNSISAINFARIKRHMKEHNADFMVVVSIGFDPSVCKDAVNEGASLLELQTCLNILKLHDECPLSPFDYIDLLKKPGIITPDMIKLLEDKKHRYENLITMLKNIIINLDFTPRNIDELKGRLDLYCENNKIPNISTEQIFNIINFLMSDMIALVDLIDNKYYLKYNLSTAREKLKIMIRNICNIIPLNHQL